MFCEHSFRKGHSSRGHASGCHGIWEGHGFSRANERMQISEASASEVASETDFTPTHFGLAADTCSRTRQDNGVPFFKAIAARSALVSSRTLHKACASSCRIARSSKSSMGIRHIPLSCTPRIDALTTNAASRNVSRFGRRLNAGLSESNFLSDRSCFQSSVRTSTHVHSPSASTGYRARAFLKTVAATWHSPGVKPTLQAKCSLGPCFWALALPLVCAESGYAENARSVTIRMPAGRIRLDRQPAQVGSPAAHDSRFRYVLITLSSLAECRAGRQRLPRVPLPQWMET